MKTMARFYGIPGCAINLRGSDDLADGEVERYVVGNPEIIFSGTYIDAISAFLDTCFASAVPDLASRINDLRTEAVADIEALQAAAAAAANEAVAEVEELAHDVNAIVESARAVE